MKKTNNGLVEEQNSHLKIIQTLTEGKHIDPPWKSKGSKEEDKAIFQNSVDKQRTYKRNNQNERNNINFNENVLTAENNEVNKWQNMKTIPGNTTYANVTKFNGKNITIVGDSMINNMKKAEFNKHIKGNATIKFYNRSSVEDMDDHILPTILDKNM